MFILDFMESVHDLYDWLAQRLNASEQLHLLDRFLIARGDGAASSYLLLARARLLKEMGEVQEAVETLMRIPVEAQTDDSLLLLIESAVSAGRRLPYIKLLERISDWDDRRRIRRLVQALAPLPEDLLLPVAQHLAQAAPVYGPLYWQELRATVRQPAQRLALIQLLQQEPARATASPLLLPALELFEYLTGDVDARQMSNDYLDATIQAGMDCGSPSGIAPFFMEWLRRHLERHDPAEAEMVHAQFSRARRWLSTAQQERALQALIEAYRRNGGAEKGVWLALEQASEAMRNSAFDEAEQWLREARNGVSAMSPESRSDMLNLIKAEDGNIKQAREAIAASFAPRYGSDPGLAAVLRLYSISAIDAFWADLADVMRENEYIARQLIERLTQLQQFAQQSGSTNVTIHRLEQLPGNVWRIELSDSARLIFKKAGRSGPSDGRNNNTLVLIALYANHDAYEKALKTRYELQNRLWGA